MTVPSDVDVVITPPAADTGSYVDWPAIIGGIVLASAISLLLLTFGSAIGLSMTDFRAGDDVSPIWIAIAAASWLLWVQISSFMAGGYLTGRLRRRHHDSDADEVDIRDGAHGLLVWGGALILGAIIAVSGLGAAANTIGSAAATLTNAASNVAGEGEGTDPTAYFTDMLFRPVPVGGTTDAAATTEAPAEDAAATEAPAGAAETPATTAASPAATTGAATTTEPAPAATPAPSTTAVATSAPADTSAARDEAGRIFAAGAISGELPAEDRTYLVQLVSTNTGLSQAEAEARVDQVVTAMDTAKAEAAEVAEGARKMGVLAAFLTAASLLVSAIGAYWAAQKGGQHRDEGTAFTDVFRRF